MPLEKICELLSVQAAMGDGYNRNGAKFILAKVQREHGQSAFDRSLQEHGLETPFGFRSGIEFKTP